MIGSDGEAWCDERWLCSGDVLDVFVDVSGGSVKVCRALVGSEITNMSLKNLKFSCESEGQAASVCNSIRRVDARC